MSVQPSPATVALAQADVAEYLPPDLRDSARRLFGESALGHLEHAMPGVLAADEACRVFWGPDEQRAGEWRVSLLIFKNDDNEEGL